MASDFGNIICGKTPSKANDNFFGGQIPFIKIPDMYNSVFITNTEDSLSEEGAQSQRNKFIPPGSVSFANIKCIMPSEEVVRSFDSLTKPIFEEILSIEHQSATLAAIRDALLPKLMHGEIAV